jgi:hypothetical protein
MAFLLYKFLNEFWSYLQYDKFPEKVAVCEPLAVKMVTADSICTIDISYLDW